MMQPQRMRHVLIAFGMFVALFSLAAIPEGSARRTRSLPSLRLRRPSSQVTTTPSPANDSQAASATQTPVDDPIDVAKSVEKPAAEANSAPAATAHADNSATQRLDAPQPTSSSMADLPWILDYAEAWKLAKEQEKLLMVVFYGENSNPYREQFEQQPLSSDELDTLLRDYVVARVPIESRLSDDENEPRIIDHGAFAELHGHDGVAIVDLLNTGLEQYESVVNILPLVAGKYYRYQPEHLAVLLDLPPGTLTQRTMVFAVRIHPERPASVQGEWCPVLCEEAASHSDYQAQIRVQGHHNWGWRFQRIIGRLPAGLKAQEVVAESWPHETLVDAAVDCVDCWRQSSGHWSAVSAPQPRFGYDMRRSSHGIWYATGLFGNRH